MEETEKLRAISEIAALLREATEKTLVIRDPVHNNAMMQKLSLITGETYPEETGARTEDIVYSNRLFSPDEHETVKRKFLKLLHSL